PQAAAEFRLLRIRCGTPSRAPARPARWATTSAFLRWRLEVLTWSAYPVRAAAARCRKAQELLLPVAVQAAAAGPRGGAGVRGAAARCRKAQELLLPVAVQAAAAGPSAASASAVVSYRPSTRASLGRPAMQRRRSSSRCPCSARRPCPPHAASPQRVPA